jgi:hypothetical protein
MKRANAARRSVLMLLAVGLAVALFFSLSLVQQADESGFEPSPLKRYSAQTHLTRDPMLSIMCIRIND